MAGRSAPNSDETRSPDYPVGRVSRAQTRRRSRGQWLISPRTFAFTLFIVLALAILSGVWIVRSTMDMNRVADQIDGLGSTQAHLALNELFAMSGRSQRTASNEWTAVELARFRAATAVLNKRIADMEARLVERSAQFSLMGSALAEDIVIEGWRAVRSIRNVVLIVEGADSIDRIDRAVRTIEFQDAVDKARRDVFIYVDRIFQLKFEQSRRQSTQIASLTAINFGLLALFTFAIIFCLFLLRSEIRTGRRKDAAEQRAKQLAYFDHITGLPNRARFAETVELALGLKKTVALVLIDLDYFQDINDRHGHLAGDVVLKEFGERIRGVADLFEGMAARLGGDEFAVYIENDDLTQLRHFCEDLLEICNVPIQFGDVSLLPSFSAGLATSTQLSMSRSSHMDDLMRVADFALYASKAAGRGRYTLYDADLEAQFSARRDLVSALPSAVESGGLEVFFQPKVDLVTGEAVSFEALVRWRHQDRLLSPAEFIVIAEETGMIIDIDRFVLRTAIEKVAAWNAEHRTAFSVSVNLSALHFRTEGDIDFVQETLNDIGFAPELLTLEITETVQLGNWSLVGRAVAQLRALGCRISIDDFGAGFSSLAYLRMINADELKIDRELVREIESSDEAQFILDAVIELAEHLGLSVVVEGIETEEQLLRIREMGCRYGQGYLFAYPVPADEALHQAMERIGDEGQAAAR